MSCTQHLHLELASSIFTLTAILGAENRLYKAPSLPRKSALPPCANCKCGSRYICAESELDDAGWIRSPIHRLWGKPAIRFRRGRRGSTLPELEDPSQKSFLKKLICGAGSSACLARSTAWRKGGARSIAASPIWLALRRECVSPLLTFQPSPIARSPDTMWLRRFLQLLYFELQYLDYPASARAC